FDGGACTHFDRSRPTSAAAVQLLFALAACAWAVPPHNTIQHFSRRAKRSKTGNPPQEHLPGAARRLRDCSERAFLLPLPKGEGTYETVSKTFIVTRARETMLLGRRAARTA